MKNGMYLPGLIRAPQPMGRQHMQLFVAAAVHRCKLPCVLSDLKL
jgi:hypothetical protein